MKHGSWLMAQTVKTCKAYLPRHTVDANERETTAESFPEPQPSIVYLVD